MAEEFRGKLGALDKEEMDQFLAGSALARLACLKPDGSPYVIPVWYQWDGSSFWFVGRQRSAWCEYIKKDGRVSIVIDSDHSGSDLPGTAEEGQKIEIPKVFVEGTAEVVEEPNIGGQWVQVAETMSYRYLGPDGPTYLVSTLHQPRWLIRLQPTRIKTWQGVGWSPKYWVEGTGGKTYSEVHA
jgi:nitroimidazol reductase NimA-like FMN-containing flavoprotein (pyridoxamine 5'-phosphate oxidase superfamily)